MFDLWSKQLHFPIKILLYKAVLISSFTGQILDGILQIKVLIDCSISIYIITCVAEGSQHLVGRFWFTFGGVYLRFINADYIS